MNKYRDSRNYLAWGERTWALHERARRMRALRARIAELEAPPVVPRGYTVERIGILPNGSSWALLMTGEMLARAYTDLRGSVNVKVYPDSYDCESASALEALIYAHRTGRRPPHAADAEPPWA